MEVQVRHADITEEDRRKVLTRMAVIAGLMIKEINEKGISEELLEKHNQEASKVDD